MIRVTLLLALVAMTAGAQGRLPLQKKKITLKSPATYAWRIKGQDPRTGEYIYYDPKPRVVPISIYTSGVINPCGDAQAQILSSFA